MSSIRFNPQPLPDLLAALENLQQQQDTATLQLSTGSTINKPSDNPAGAAELVEINDLSSQVDSFQQSVGSINGLLSTADSTLSSVTTALQRAITLGTEGANGTLSNADRADIAAEVSDIQSQLISLANTSYQGQFIFSGTSGAQPFVANSSSTSGVTYNGNNGVNTVAIGPDYDLQVNQPGSQVFTGSGGNVFQSIQDLINALQTNSDISGAVAEVSSASSYVSNQRVFYGNAMNQTTSQSNYLDSEKTGLSQQVSNISAADIATVATQVTSDQTAATAALEAIGRMSQLGSLFDYLR
ncbi:MAG TPA: flagellar hook-associated protein FlgL [Terriglobales bacterium]